MLDWLQVASPLREHLLQLRALHLPASNSLQAAQGLLQDQCLDLGLQDHQEDRPQLDQHKAHLSLDPHLIRVPQLQDPSSHHQALQGQDHLLLLRVSPHQLQALQEHQVLRPRPAPFLHLHRAHLELLQGLLQGLRRLVQLCHPTVRRPRDHRECPPEDRQHRGQPAHPRPATPDHPVALPAAHQAARQVALPAAHNRVHLQDLRAALHQDHQDRRLDRKVALPRAPPPCIQEACTGSLMEVHTVHPMARLTALLTDHLTRVLTALLMVVRMVHHMVPHMVLHMVLLMELLMELRTAPLMVVHTVDLTVDRTDHRTDHLTDHLMEVLTALPTLVHTVLPMVVHTAAHTVLRTAGLMAVHMVLHTAGRTVLPTVDPTVLPTAGRMVLPTARRTVCPTAPRTVLPMAGHTGLPTAGPTVLPTARLTALRMLDRRLVLQGHRPPLQDLLHQVKVHLKVLQGMDLQDNLVALRHHRCRVLQGHRDLKVLPKDRLVGHPRLARRARQARQVRKAHLAPTECPQGPSKVRRVLPARWACSNVLALRPRLEVLLTR